MALLERYIEILQLFTKLPSFPVTCGYLVVVFLSRFWRKLVGPLSLRPVLVIHNFVCVILSFVSFIYLSSGCYGAGTIFEKVHHNNVVLGCWVYTISKYLELLDTVFMILRHNGRQITFLHVYHHASILLLGEYSYHHLAWPPCAFILGFNSFVHIVMYTYYGLSALNAVQRLDWKKSLTQLQIFQFFCGILHGVVGYMYYGVCIYAVLYGLSMLGLFSNFYIRAYVKPQKLSSSEKRKN